MLSDAELGFVLKRFLPYKCKFSILTQTMGKINIITSLQEGRNLWPGSLISLIGIDKLANVFSFASLEVLIVPTESNVNDICWLHQVLEICYFFLSLNEPVSDVFKSVYNALLMLSNYNFNEIEDKLLKRLFVVNIFFLIGFYPSQNIKNILSKYGFDLYRAVDFSSIEAVKSLQTYLIEIKDVEIKELDCWILLNLNKHPNKKFFKTTKFLNFI